MWLVSIVISIACNRILLLLILWSSPLHCQGSDRSAQHVQESSAIAIAKGEGEWFCTSGTAAYDDSFVLTGRPQRSIAELRSHISARQASPAASSSSFSTSIAIATPVVVVQPRTSTSSSAPLSQALTSQLQVNPPDQNEPLNRQDRKDEAQSSSESSAATTPNINPSSSPSAPNLYHEEEKRGDGVLAERPPSSGR